MKLCIWYVLLGLSVSSPVATDILDLFPVVEEVELQEVDELSLLKNLKPQDIWCHTEPHNVLGVIGDKFQRIKIAFRDVRRTSNSHLRFDVAGASNVSGNIGAFHGWMRIDSVFATVPMTSDSEYEPSNDLQGQYTIVGSYEFVEDSAQYHSGTFQGRFYTLVYLDDQGSWRYDDRSIQSQGYLNNAFLGTWRIYDGSLSMPCSWGDYRVPHKAIMFNAGGSEFDIPAESMSNGWDVFVKAWIDGDEIAKRQELHHWWE